MVFKWSMQLIGCWIQVWMHKEIPTISTELYEHVIAVFQENAEARASRGGKAAHLSWLKRTGKVT